MSYTDDINKASHCNLPWEQLTGKNILVTGATGMIGSALVEVLLSHSSSDYQIYASGRSKKKFDCVFADYRDCKNLHFLEYDVRNALLSDIDYQIIIYCAGVASPLLYKNDPVGVLTSNIIGVNNVMMYGVNHGLERFLYVSSGEMYGEGNGQAFHEEDSGYVDCTQMRAGYPTAKRASESLCIAYSHQFDIEVVIARPCHVYGPKFSETDNRIYAEFTNKVLNNEPIVLKSRGDQIRSWCYVVDCASGLIHILLKGENGKAYNIADPNSVVSIREFAEMFF